MLPTIDTRRDLKRILMIHGVRLEMLSDGEGFRVDSVRGYPGKDLADHIVMRAVSLGALAWVPAQWVEDVQRSMVRELLEIAS